MTHQTRNRLLDWSIKVSVGVAIGLIMMLTAGAVAQITENERNRAFREQGDRFTPEMHAAIEAAQEASWLKQQQEQDERWRKFLMDNYPPPWLKEDLKEIRDNMATKREVDELRDHLRNLSGKVDKLSTHPHE